MSPMIRPTVSAASAPTQTAPQAIGNARHSMAYHDGYSRPVSITSYSFVYGALAAHHLLPRNARTMPMGEMSKFESASRGERNDYTGDGEREAEGEALAIARSLPQRGEDQSIARDQLVAPGQELAESLALLGREIAAAPLRVGGEG